MGRLFRQLSRQYRHLGGLAPPQQLVEHEARHLQVDSQLFTCRQQRQRTAREGQPAVALAGWATFDVTLARTPPMGDAASVQVDGRALEFIDHRGMLVLERHARMAGRVVTLRTDSAALHRLADLLSLEAVELGDPSPAASRHAIGDLARDMSLGRDRIDDFLLGVNEVVTNARLHATPPVVVRAWGTPGRVVVAVNDPGKGPEDPFAGLLPPESSVREGGFGLWITHQVCPETAMEVSEDGFTVRLAVGNPAASSGA
jgi:anti-sigma regulatory factor (Ser/Thr protein kinase)